VHASKSWWPANRPPGGPPGLTQHSRADHPSFALLAVAAANRCGGGGDSHSTAGEGFAPSPAAAAAAAGLDALAQRAHKAQVKNKLCTQAAVELVCAHDRSSTVTSGGSSLTHLHTAHSASHLSPGAMPTRMLMARLLRTPAAAQQLKLLNFTASCSGTTAATLSRRPCSSPHS
jgi:hypothetical protein